MMYLLKHTNKNFFNLKFFKISGIFLLVFLLVFILNFLAPLNFIVSSFFSPLFKVGDYFYNIVYQIPMNEGTDISALQLDYESLKYENNELRESLLMKGEKNVITAFVIARSPQIPLDTLYIDKGIEDGLNIGEMVLGSERVLIGQIVKVFKNKAIVSLDSFPGFISPGFVMRTNEPLEIKGVGGESMQAKVPIDFDIVLQDKIMLSNSPNYIIAVVSVIEEVESSGFKKVLFSLPLNISKKRLLFVEPVIWEQ